MLKIVFTSSHNKHCEIQNASEFNFFLLKFKAWNFVRIKRESRWWNKRSEKFFLNACIFFFESTSGQCTAAEFLMKDSWKKKSSLNFKFFLFRLQWPKLFDYRLNTMHIIVTVLFSWFFFLPKIFFQWTLSKHHQ